MVNLNTQNITTYWPTSSQTGPVGAVTPVSPAAKIVSGRRRTAVSLAPFPSVRPDPVSAGVSGRMRILHPSVSELEAFFNSGRVNGSRPPAEVFKDVECRTCAERTYKDGSDDPGVSYKTPTKISPEQAPSAVRGHEMEHVTREQAKARREGREVISQSVRLHTSICPECGRPFISGGVTTTVTKGSSDGQNQPEDQAQAAAAVQERQ